MPEITNHSTTAFLHTFLVCDNSPREEYSDVSGLTNPLALAGLELVGWFRSEYCPLPFSQDLGLREWLSDEYVAATEQKENVIANINLEPQYDDHSCIFSIHS